MHPETKKFLARARQGELLDEARNERLSAISRGQRLNGRPCGPGPAWRRIAGTRLVDFGTWLAGSRIEPASDMRG